MARAKRASDETYNARRRYRRQAQRYLKKAESSTGATRSRYESLARRATEKAVATYAKGSKPQGQVGALADRLGVQQSGPVSNDALSELISSSRDALQGSQRGMSRADTAKDILSGNVASRFYAGLIGVWGRTKETKQAPNKAILDYFGADSMLDVLEMLEQAGIDLYSPEPPEGDAYHTVALQIQHYVLASRRVNGRR